ncbi:MAG: 1,4-dihydroxy-2-naphthoate polyprenyltransferase [Acidimicrobiaceae bacterium]|nr:1,4-dihydroxy-2-naphthoate polyprenyltransferase [Acidimicrobiaceae bacterium]
MTTADNTPAPTLADWVAGARPRTLPAAVVPVAVAAGVAAGIGESFGDGVVWWRVAAALVVSLLLQVGVNYANDYSDGVRGTDDVRVGPMRLVATGTASPSAVKRAALASFGLAAVVGLGLAIATSWWLVLVGVAAILAAWGYTGGPKPYGYLGLGEVFVFVFFGLVATAGTTYVAIEEVPWVTWPAATGVGLIACALLVVNNLRDIPTDTAAGKRTLAVRLGDRPTRWFYVVLIVATFVCVVVSAFERPWALLGLLGIPASIGPVKRVLGGATGPELIPVLAATGQTQLAFGLTFAFGLALG